MFYVKNQHFQIPIRSGTHGHVSTSSYELLSDPWVNKLQFTIFNFFFLQSSPKHWTSSLWAIKVVHYVKNFLFALI